MENNKKIKGLDNRAKTAMFKYDWPGNIRELRNCIESAVVLCSGDTITLEDLPPSVSSHSSSESKCIEVPVGITLDEAEKIIIQENLLLNRNNKSKTAEVLDIGRKTLQRKLYEWGMEAKEEEDSSGNDV